MGTVREKFDIVKFDNVTWTKIIKNHLYHLLEIEFMLFGVEKLF